MTQTKTPRSSLIRRTVGETANAPDARKVKATVYLGENTKEDLDNFAFMQRKSISEVVEEALRAHMGKVERARRA